MRLLLMTTLLVGAFRISLESFAGELTVLEAPIEKGAYHNKSPDEEVARQVDQGDLEDGQLPCEALERDSKAHRRGISICGWRRRSARPGCGHGCGASIRPIGRSG